MARFFLACLALALWLAPALALSPEEVIRLKKAGVSEATIQKMLEQERRGAVQPGLVRETKDERVYQAGEGDAAEAERHRRQEEYKLRKSMDALKGVIIDQRRQNRPPPSQQ